MSVCIHIYLHVFVYVWLPLLSNSYLMYLRRQSVNNLFGEQVCCSPFLAAQPERFSRCCLYQHLGVLGFFSPFWLEEDNPAKCNVPVKSVFHQEKSCVYSNTLSQSSCCPEKQHSRFKWLSTAKKSNPDVPIAPFCLFLLHLVYIYTFSIPLQHRRFLLSIRIGGRKEEWGRSAKDREKKDGGYFEKGKNELLG